MVKLSEVPFGHIMDIGWYGSNPEVLQQNYLAHFVVSNCVSY